MTHTVATLEVSPGAYHEIATILRNAGYHHVFVEDGLIDMTGIGLIAERRAPLATPVRACLSPGGPDYCEVHAA